MVQILVLKITIDWLKKRPLKLSTYRNRPKGTKAKAQGSVLTKKQGEFYPSSERAPDPPCPVFNIHEYLSALQAFMPMRASIERASPVLNAGALSGHAHRNKLQT